MEAKKVDVEVVNSGAKEDTPIKADGFLKRAKLIIALVLDITDFFIGWVPLANTIWDFVTFFILLAILKKKKLAFISLIELPLFGLPPFSIVDMFIPMATLIVLIDNEAKT